MPRSFGSAILSIVTSKFSTMLLGMVLTPLLVRFLGPADYGRYAVIISIFAFANFLMTSGTNDAIRKFISERDNLEWQHAIFGKLFPIAIGLAILVSTVFSVAAATGVVEMVFGVEYVLLFYLLSVFAIGRQAREFLLRTLLGLQLETISEPIKILQKALFVMMAVTAAYYGYGVVGVLVADIVTSSIIFLILILVLSKYINFRDAIREPSVDIPSRSIYRYTSSTVVLFGLLMSLYHIDVLILQQYEPEQTVGYYKSALVIAESLWFAPIAIQMALLQRVSSFWEANDLESIQKQSARATQFSLIFTLLVVMGMAALADIVVPLYLGVDFEPAITPLMFLLPGVVGFAAARPSIAILQARRSLRPLMLATGGCAGMNLILNLFLIPRYGMLGAAISTSVSYMSIMIFQAFASRYVGLSPLKSIRVLPLVVTVFIAAIPTFGLAEVLPPHLALLLVPPVGFIVYWTAAISTGVVRLEEVQPLLSYLPKNMEQQIKTVLKVTPKLYKQTT